MTSEDKDQLDDEFEDFLAGQGELARQLSALPQPESPERLNDAIIATAEAEMAREKLEAVMAQRPAAANSARWRMPMAMAAGVIGAVLLMLQWQRDGYSPPSPAVMREQPKLAATPDAAPQPVPADAAAAAAPAPAPQAAPAQPTAHARAKPAASTMAKAADKAHPSSSQEFADAAPAPIIAEEHPQVLAYAPSPPPPPAPVRERLTLAARSAPPSMIALPPPALPSAAPIAPISTTRAGLFARSDALAASTAKPAAWLNVIDEMLKADLRKDALEEWKKFRLAYPDYPVPDALAKRIAAIE